jgi:ADP-dependent NAD(P)H-hydrate dehydratase / NAD(P)H-hydrate epimerase
MHFDYWRRQSDNTPLFPDIAWSKPEQRSQAGKLAVIGGNKLGFVAIRDAYETAEHLGAGKIRAILPDVLKRIIPVTTLDAVFLPSNASGGFSKEGHDEFQAACSWADVCLLVGDAGRNSETAVAFESIVADTSQLVITRDALDLLMPAMQRLVDRDSTTLVASFAQIQKIFQAVYYPKILSFSMQLMQLVETLHKFTITYPVTIVTFHHNQLIVAHDGQVVTQEFDQPMAIWRGITATRAACYLLWNPKKPLEAITTSFIA